MSDIITKEDVKVEVHKSKKKKKLSKKKHGQTKLENERKSKNGNGFEHNNRKDFHQSESTNENDATNNSISNFHNQIIVPRLSINLIRKIKIMLIISIVFSGIFCITFIVLLIYFSIKLNYRDNFLMFKITLGLSNSLGLIAVNIRILRFLCLCPYPYFNKCWFLYVMYIAIYELGTFVYGWATMQYKGEILLLGDSVLTLYATGAKCLMSIFLIISTSIYLSLNIILFILMKKHQNSLRNIEASLAEYQYSGWQIFCIPQRGYNCCCRNRGCLS